MQPTRRRLAAARRWARDTALRLWREDDGYLLFTGSTEAVLWVTIIALSIIVGLATVRFAVIDVFIDAAEALANRESSFVFDDSDPRFFFKRPIPSFFDTNPQVGGEAGPIYVVPAQPEGSL